MNLNLSPLQRQLIAKMRAGYRIYKGGHVRSPRGEVVWSDRDVLRRAEDTIGELVHVRVVDALIDKRVLEYITQSKTTRLMSTMRASASEATTTPAKPAPELFQLTRLGLEVSLDQ